jgi:hypothetical protein
MSLGFYRSHLNPIMAHMGPLLTPKLAAARTAMGESVVNSALQRGFIHPETDA